MIGNSWTAPINIEAMEETDFVNAEATIYIYNTGNDEVGNANGDGTAGQWLSIPVNTAQLDAWDGLKVIPSGQAFEVHANAAGASLTLDYDRVVRGGTNLNEPLRAPGRKQVAAKNDDINVMRIRVAGTNMTIDQYLLENEMFTTGHDNGWDGKFAEGDDRAAQFYSINEEQGNMAVNALPELEGTQLGFVPNSDNQFTISFRYNGSTYYYLNDLQMMKSTLIQNGNTYTFFTSDYDMVERFVISKTPFQVPGISTGVDSQDDTTKVEKLMINGRLYILKRGHLYDAQGKMVK